MKIVTNVADGAGTVEVGPDRVDPVMPTIEWDGRPYVHVPTGTCSRPTRSRWSARCPACGSSSPAVRARERLNRDHARAPGRLARDRRRRARPTTTCARRSATSASTTDAQRAGIRLLKLGMLYPLDEQTVREFAAGLDEILVVEEKRPFLERHVKEALYGVADAPRDRRQARRARRAADPADGRARRRRDRACRRRAAPDARRDPGVAARLRELDAIAARPAARLGRAAHARSSARAARTTRSHGAPDGTLVGAGHRLPHDGAARARGHGRDHRHHADGRRGRAVDRHGAVHRRRATSSRTSATAPSTTPARWRSAAAVAAGRQHHLQAALQRRRGDDRRPGRRGRSCACPS